MFQSPSSVPPSSTTTHDLHTPAGRYSGYESTGTIQPFSLVSAGQRSFANLNQPRISGVNYDAITAIEQEQYITIHSADRDRSVYPNPAQCVVKLDESATGALTGVHKVKLLGGILPSVNNTTLSEPFLILRIPEFSGGHLTSNNGLAEGAFAYVQLDRPITDSGFLNLKNDFNCMSNVTPPNPTIKQLSITFLKSDGTTFDMTGGSPDNGVTADKSKNYVLFFKIQKS